MIFRPPLRKSVSTPEFRPRAHLVMPQPRRCRRLITTRTKLSLLERRLPGEIDVRYRDRLRLGRVGAEFARPQPSHAEIPVQEAPHGPRGRIRRARDVMAHKNNAISLRLDPICFALEVGGRDPEFLAEASRAHDQPDISFVSVSRDRFFDNRQFRPGHQFDMLLQIIGRRHVEGVGGILDDNYRTGSAIIDENERGGSRVDQGQESRKSESRFYADHGVCW